MGNYVIETLKEILLDVQDDHRPPTTVEADGQGGLECVWMSSEYILMAVMESDGLALTITMTNRNSWVENKRAFYRRADQVGCLRECLTALKSRGQ